MLNLYLFTIWLIVWGTGCFVYLFWLRDIMKHDFLKSFFDTFFNTWMLVLQAIILVVGELCLAKF